MQNEDRELISYGRRLEKIQSKIEQLNENLSNLSEQQADVKAQIFNKEEEIKKFNRIKQMSKNIAIISSILSLSSSAISGGLSLADYSQEGGFLSLAGSATSGLFALVGSIVDNYFSIKEMDAQKSKVELEKKLEMRLEEKFYRDRRSLRESWIELVDIYEDLYLLRHISVNFPVEVDKALSNFVEALSKVSIVKKNKQTSDIYINIRQVTTTLEDKKENGNNINNIIKDEELLEKWKENGNNIAEKIKELVEKIGDYRQKLINRLKPQHQNPPLPYQYIPLQTQPNQYPSFPLPQPYQYSPYSPYGK
ncbi:unnamed protein product [Rhizophagus irregularis]|uniref:Uncharacterized protein n=1 Tax=Rhizophagus irregularis TaxID=588596 RepID=A0A2N1NDX7_9GLOM|nr:hypothetical protein RhiirC2_777605 [Rhizophagus irregularis]CAB4400710.1 unnamed protein product [Rhizophagus irregularis]CAB5380040.1 unnamed protein product [Rhizophagus irregularis]